jgi:murein endopeptidase
MTDAQRDYIAAVKAGKIDAFESIRDSVGSKGGQSFCGPSNGFLVEGRPLVPTPENRIELRNEARCTNFGTDPLIGAMEWMGREIKHEFHEPEFDQARLIIGDISAPRGGCVAGRGGRRAHKSHTGGVDIDVAYFNPRAGHAPEEHFTRTFYVASNWWLLKKMFKNPFVCIKVVFVDRSHIRALDRYAKNDPEWTKLKKFIRHIRGHRDHFHFRVGSGPGVPGCASDPALEEDEDQNEENVDSILAKNPLEEADSASDAEGDDDDPSVQPGRGIASVAVGAAASGDDRPAAADPSEQNLASGVQIAQTTLPPYKLEPSITEKYTVRRHRHRRKIRRHSRKHRK